jgi:hypothetical protein
VSTPDDPDNGTPPSGDEPQGAELPAVPASGGTAPVLPPEALTALVESIVRAGILVQSTEVEGDIRPMARKMDPIDLSTYILASRYRTINAVLVLLALAVCVGALALGSHSNTIPIISLTSACTVAVTFGVSAAKRRRERRHAPKPGDATKHENDRSGQ